MEERQPASVILITHDVTTRSRVHRVIEALLEDPEGPNEVVLVDNARSEHAREIAENYEVTLVQRDRGGFSDGCNAGAAVAAQPIVVLLGHDTLPDPGWLPPLVEALELPDVGAVIPIIEDGARPGTFNTSGGHLTYLGLAWVSDHGRVIPEISSVEIVDFPCGGAMAMKAETWGRFEGFKDEYFIYQEDSDLGWRLRLAGLTTVRVPNSRVVHDYEFGRQHNKMFLLERNRLLTVLANYRPITKLLLAPVLVATEFAISIVAIRDGWFGAKAGSWKAVWTHRHLVKEWRDLTESHRVISDREMISSMRSGLSGMPEIPAPQGLGVANALLELNRRLVVGFLNIFEDR